MKHISIECPVLPLARHFDVLAAQWSAADQDGKDDICDATADAMQEVADRASHLSPSSATGAAFQIMLASAEVDRVRNGNTEAHKAAAARRLERLLYRAADIVGTAVDDLPNARRHIMPATLDPRFHRISGRSA